MAEKLKNQICKNLPTTYENEKKEETNKTNYKPRLKCNIWKCHKCHPNAPTLSKAEISKINKKMEESKKPRKLKECNGKCIFCIKAAEIANKYITEHNAKITQEQEKLPKEEINKEINHEQNEDIIMEENDPLIEKIPNIHDLEKIEIKKDGNCLSKSILEILDINQNEYMTLKKEIATAVIEENWENETLQQLNYESKE